MVGPFVLDPTKPNPEDPRERSNPAGPEVVFRKLEELKD